jgi:hypothetical protein
LARDEAAIIAAEMDRLDDREGAEILSWTRVPPGRPRLAARVDFLEARLRLTMADLRLLGDEASWMAREAEGAIELALKLLAEEWAADGLKPTQTAPVA